MQKKSRRTKVIYHHLSFQTFQTNNSDSKRTAEIPEVIPTSHTVEWSSSLFWTARRKGRPTQMAKATAKDSCGAKKLTPARPRMPKAHAALIILRLFQASSVSTSFS